MTLYELLEPAVGSNITANSKEVITPNSPSSEPDRLFNRNSRNARKCGIEWNKKDHRPIGIKCECEHTKYKQCFIISLRSDSDSCAQCRDKEWTDMT
ncbi:unnamed protein product, partial [Allacma fusca]